MMDVVTALDIVSKDEYRERITDENLPGLELLKEQDKRLSRAAFRVGYETALVEFLRLVKG